MAETKMTGRRARDRWFLSMVLVLAVGALGYAAFRATTAAPEPEPPAGDVAVLSKGDPVDLTAHLVPGKYTIYDFYADWCPPCRTLDGYLRALAANHPNVAVRKIDIIDWTSPVVQQHDIHDLPYMVLYGPDGTRLAAGDDVFPMVMELFKTRLF